MTFDRRLHSDRQRHRPYSNIHVISRKVAIVAFWRKLVMLAAEAAAAASATGAEAGGVTKRVITVMP